jgi:hypothetical protein
MATLAEKALAIVLGIETIAGKGPTGRAGRAALRAGAKAIVAGAPVAGRVATRAVLPAAASVAAANPVSTGVGLGLGFTQTPPGQALLEAAAERGAADRVRAQQLLDEFIFRNVTRPAEMAGDIVTSPTFVGQVKTKAKKKVSKYSKAVKAGMSAVKTSKFGGKKGTIVNPKATFATVNKVVSAVNKGNKVAAKGIRGTIAKAARKILK